MLPMHFMKQLCLEEMGRMTAGENTKCIESLLTHMHFTLSFKPGIYFELHLSGFSTPYPCLAEAIKALYLE